MQEESAKEIIQKEFKQDAHLQQLIEGQQSLSSERWRKVNLINSLTCERQNFKDNSKREQVYQGYLKLMNLVSRSYQETGISVENLGKRQDSQ